MTTTRILVGDCVKRLRELPDESVHCVVTSIPYWALRDYGLPDTAWPAVSFAPMPGLPETEIAAWTGCLGLEPDPLAFVGHVVLVFRELRRALRRDGTLWLNVGDTYSGGRRATRSVKVAITSSRRSDRATVPRSDLRVPGLKPKDLVGVPWRVAFALQADGWFLRKDNIWWKRNPMPESAQDRPTTDHEIVFLLSRRPRYYYDQVAVRQPVTGTAKPRGVKVSPKSDAVPAAFAGGGGPSRIRNNPSFTRAVRDLTATRSLRSVWDIPTVPYRGSHYATFPPTLPAMCILAGTSQEGCCAECGAPWVRQVERVRTHEANGARCPTAGGWDTGPGRHDTMRKIRPAKGHPTSQVRDDHDVRRGPTLRIETVGWEPSCQHGGVPVPCVVLDPFGGVGTTALVATRQGRNSISIEMSPKYAHEGADRIRAEGELLNTVEVLEEDQPAETCTAARSVESDDMNRQGGAC